ncbi:MAG TPA: DUF6036 family nucleotidyltransferase [Bacteroidota bacterium]
MQIQEEILLLTVDRLDALKIPYYITGSVAVSVYGKPRFTHDVDVVITLLPVSLSSLVEAFQKDFYVSMEGLQDALNRHSMANLIHHASGMKIDLWMYNEHSDFAQSQFKRRALTRVFGRDIYFISPEDLILQKLLWHQETQSDRDWSDVAGIWEFMHDTLDKGYIVHWVHRLMLTQSFQKLSVT